MDAKTQASANFHTVTKGTVFDPSLEDARFKEYRRRWHENPKAFKAEQFPIHLDLESTGVCNLKCPFCATTSDNWGGNQGGYMAMDLFKKIIDEGAENGLCSIKLSFRGEPLMHKNVPEMVAYAREKGVLDVYFNTNATLLNEKTAHRLIDAGLPRISISFEGVTREVYESNRVGAKFEKVIENVKRLRDIKRQRGVVHPQIRVQTVMLPELKPIFDRYVEFWKDTADEVGYLDARQEGPGFDHRGLQGPWACPFLWQRMVVLWDGTILPCLVHGVADFSDMVIGNARTMAIKDAWLSEKERRLRELHKTSRAHMESACDQCSFRASELAKMGIVKGAS